MRSTPMRGSPPRSEARPAISPMPPGWRGRHLPVAVLYRSCLPGSFRTFDRQLIPTSKLRSPVSPTALRLRWLTRARLSGPGPRYDCRFRRADGRQQEPALGFRRRRPCAVRNPRRGSRNSPDEIYRPGHSAHLKLPNTKGPNSCAAAAPVRQRLPSPTSSTRTYSSG